MKMNKIYLTPGPSELYFTVGDHVRTAMKLQIPSISHRSSQFTEIYSHAENELRDMLGLPINWHVLFTSSATEIWERLIQNCVDKKVFHAINGEFSSRFASFSEKLDKELIKHQVEPGEGIFVNQFPDLGDVEMIALTHNETSTGVMMREDEISKARALYPNALIVVDAVSSMPHPQFDYSKIDSVYFSVQKGMGLPAGLGVWLVNDRCIEKSEQLLAKGNSIGTYHALPEMIEKALKKQTSETPNVLGIYLLANVLKDMNSRGIETIRRETNYKAAVLDHCIENHPVLSHFVDDAMLRSKTVIVADAGERSGEFIQKLEEFGFILGAGYSHFKNKHIRIANFPAHSKEQIELLADKLMEIS
jgi:phosphoserine aminotransferase